MTTPAEYARAKPPEESERHVTMSNQLARYAQGLNLAEKRLVALGMAKTDSVSMQALLKAAKNNQGWRLKVTALEYAEAFGVSSTSAYEQLKSAADKLFDRYIRWEEKGPRGKPGERKIRWVSERTIYADGDGYVELNFTAAVAPHLLGLRKQFTTYKLKHASAFDSIYAWRLYELLKSWQSTGLYAPSIEEFHEAMESPPSCRKDFKALRVRVIEPAVESIKTKAGLLVEWKQVRGGSRRVTGLEFRFEPDPQGRLDIEEDDANITPSDVT